jgi:hypothetical protein
VESMLLKKYEKQISSKATFIAVSVKDKEIYETQFGGSHIKYLPVFIPYTSIDSNEGRGSYCLYHGNLAIAENEKAVKWLLKNVFRELSIPLVIAGKNPSKRLQQLVSHASHTRLLKNPGDEQMQLMIREAQINILPSFNATGIKIKLLNALFNGRHCVVNNAAVDGTGLQALCCVANDSALLKKNIEALYAQAFKSSDIEMRKEVLLTAYDNERNARRLIQWIY